MSTSMLKLGVSPHGHLQLRLCHHLWDHETHAAHSLDRTYQLLVSAGLEQQFKTIFCTKISIVCITAELGFRAIEDGDILYLFNVGVVLPLNWYSSSIAASRAVP